MEKSKIHWDRYAFAAICITATCFVLGVIMARADEGSGQVSWDAYSYFYPGVLHALRSLREGEGLLWNPYQGSGQPFLALGVNGLLYPVNWVFAFLDREAGMLTSAGINLVIGGAGAYWLGRELKLSPAAALCGAIAFQLGTSTRFVAGWGPMHLSGYVWLPVALFLTERLLRAPELHKGLALSAALTMQLYTGFPQTAFFTYQLIALRVAWGLATRPVERSGSGLWIACVGLVLPPVLAAVLFVPASEFIPLSLRGGALSAAEIGKGITLASVRANNGVWSVLIGRVFVLCAMFFPLALMGRRHRNAAIFYLLVAAFYFALAFGPGTLLFDIYASLPLGSLFRHPPRFLWVMNFCLAMLAALGVQQLVDRSGETGRRRFAPIAAMIAGLVAFAWLYQRVFVIERQFAVAAIAAALALTLAPQRFRSMALVFPLLLAINGLMLGTGLYLNQRTGDVYGANADVFEFVRKRITPEDRIFVVARHQHLALMVRSGMVHGIPEVNDYEPQTAHTYAEYFVYMQQGSELTDIVDWDARPGTPMPAGFKHRLLDLIAARYVIVEHELDNTAKVFGAPLRSLLRDERLTVYENNGAQKRALFVPRIQVVPESDALGMLASGKADPSRVALVSELPRSGFQGSPLTTGHAKIVESRAQTVKVEVDSTGPGFLFLADQYFPGWSAQVNGEQSEILRANHAFRLVEIPAGHSVVTFTYRPASVYIGGTISTAAWAGVAFFWWRSRRREDL